MPNQKTEGYTYVRRRALQDVHMLLQSWKWKVSYVLL